MGDAAQAATPDAPVAMTPIRLSAGDAAGAMPPSETTRADSAAADTTKPPPITVPSVSGRSKRDRLALVARLAFLPARPLALIVVGFGVVVSFGLGIGSAVDMPPIDQPIMHTLGYHIRSGGHDVTEYDWKAYLDFADKHWAK